MNRRSALRNLLAGAGSFLSALGADNAKLRHPEKTSQKAPKPDDENYTFHSQPRLVLLDVSVKNHQGGFVSGLSKDNFKAFEDGHPQEITVFEHDDAPVTVGLVVDESRSMTPKRGA